MLRRFWQWLKAIFNKRSVYIGAIAAVASMVVLRWFADIALWVSVAHVPLWIVLIFLFLVFVIFGDRKVIAEELNALKKAKDAVIA